MTEQELLIIARLKNEVSRPVKEIKADLATMTGELAAQDKLTGAQTRQLRGLGTEMRNAQRDTKRLAQEFSDLGSKMTRFLTLPVAALFVYSVKAASDLNEQVQKTNVVFGDFATGVHDFAKTAADSLGMSQRQFEQTAGSIGALLAPLGIGQEQAAQMSTTLTQLAGDLASFYNTSTEDALAALQSGLVGQVRPLRRYGVQLSEVRLQEYAWANGIAHSGQQLTSTQKSLAAYGVILNDTKLAQGDFIRTQDGMANQTRKAQAELENAAASIGEKLIPIAIDLLHVVTGLVDGFTALPDPVQNTIILMLGIGAVLGPLSSIIGAWMKLSQWIQASRIQQRLFGQEAVGGGVAGAAGGGGKAGALLPIGGKALPAAALAYGAYDFGKTAADEGWGSAPKLGGRLLADLLLMGAPEILNSGLSALGGLTGTDLGLGGLWGSDKAIDGQLKLKDAITPTTAAAVTQAKSIDELVSAYSDLSKELDATAASWDVVLGRFLDAEDATAGLVDKVQKMADDLMKPVADPRIQAATIAGDAREITRSVEANVLALQKAGKLPAGEESFFGAQISQLMQLKQAFPEIAGQLDDYIRKLRDAKDLGKVVGGGTTFAPLPGHKGFQFGPFGDTATPRGWDGASGSFADTMAIHQRLDAMVPGRRFVTSGVRGAGSSDHAHGRALDLVGSNLASYATAVRKIGGFAEFHGRGPARHLHVVPRTGPPPRVMTGGGGSPVSFGNVIVNREIDLERAVARGVRTARRDADERSFH